MTDAVSGNRVIGDKRARRSPAALIDARPTETRQAFKTSEFWVFIMVAAGVMIATYNDDNDSLTEWRGWLLFCATGIAYILSRGIAKAGSSEPHVGKVDLD
jgi:hypothetical protein